MKSNASQKITFKGKSFFVTGNDDFWLAYKMGRWEPETFEIMEKYLDKDHSYVDFGAWIGPTVLFGAQIAKKVYALEPDMVAFDAFRTNLEMNPSINEKVVRNPIAVGRNTAIVSFGAVGEYGDSMSSLLGDKAMTVVHAFSMKDIFEKYNINDCNFVKMDIEGGEALVFPTALEVFEKWKPTLYLSLHAQMWKKPQDYFDRIFPVLALYKHIYNTKGELITLKEIPSLKQGSAIVATDL